MVILGCGYTGQRVAARFADRGVAVVATARTPHGFAEVAFSASPEPDLSFIPEGARMLWSIPTIEGVDCTPGMMAALAARKPRRVVYLSTTGVYGETHVVTAESAAAPRRPQYHARIATENAVLQGPWSGIVLRPAAIYGPDRGIHVSMQLGKFRMGGDGGNYVSRIHVDDLAAHCEAALFSEVTGAWPVADEYPCTTREIAEYCSATFGVPMPPSVEAGTLHHTRQANRRVDGSAIRHSLGISLLFPTFREGLWMPR